MCRTSVTDLQEWYNRDYEKFVWEESQLHDQHARILKKLKRYDFTLVDNLDFITWAVTTPNPEHLEAVITDIVADPQIPEDVMRYSHHIDGTLTESVLDQWTASYFYGSAGATPIETEEKLQFALDAMFYYRGKLGLEE